MVHLSDAQVDLRVVDGLHASSIHVPNAGLQDTRVRSNTFIQSVEGKSLEIHAIQQAPALGLCPGT